MRWIPRMLVALLCLFLLPALTHTAIWLGQDRPASWRQADWSSAGLLPDPALDEASIRVLHARTGGLKGALSVHSWLVIKRPGNPRYERYDVVGWGNPVRRDAYAADARWYSNVPEVGYHVSGKQARALLPEIDAAIAGYRWQNRGDYRIWPGPNSNTFVASIIRAVPSFDAVLPPTAIGRDFPEDNDWFMSAGDGWRGSIQGYAGFVIGRRQGLELNLLGLVLGLNPLTGEIKLPGFGSLRPLGDGAGT